MRKSISCIEGTRFPNQHRALTKKQVSLATMMRPLELVVQEKEEEEVEGEKEVRVSMVEEVWVIA